MKVIDLETVIPGEQISFKGLDGYETYAEGSCIFIRPKWISVKDQLPPRSSQEQYFITDGESIGFSYFGCNDRGFEHDEFIGGECSESLQQNITHWMPLPQLPKVVS